jgi:mono/diheme cytochrome c family protein
MVVRVRVGVLIGILLLGWNMPRRALGQVPATLPEGVTAAMVTQGKKLFHGKALCVACHGDAARGGVAPSLRDSLWLHSMGGYTDIVAQIRRGVPAESTATKLAMPPLGGARLSDQEIGAVAAYVWSLRLEARR